MGGKCALNEPGIIRDQDRLRFRSNKMGVFASNKVCAMGGGVEMIRFDFERHAWT